MPHLVLAQTPGDPPYALSQEAWTQLRTHASISTSDPQHRLSRGADVFTNGSFETGDLSGWTTQDVNDASIPLTVSEAGWSPSSFAFFATAPTDGDFALVHGFDGEGPGTIQLAQEVTLPEDALTVAFDYRAGWDMLNWEGSTEDRAFVVAVEPAGAGTPVQTDTIFTAAAGEMVVDTGVIHGSVDVSAYANSTVRIRFIWRIPETHTGPGFFQLDNVFVTPVSQDAQALVYPAELDLGVAAVGSAGASATVSIRGVGAEAVTITDISASNEHVQLSDLPALPFTLAPEAALPITVTFAPQAAGDLSSTLTIGSTDADEPEQEVVLGGTGVSVAPAEEGVLYAASVGRNNQGQLLEVDPATGAATPIGSMDVPIADLAVHASGELYGVYARKLYLIDAATGTATVVATLAGSAGVITMAFSPDGILYGLGSADISLGFRFNLYKIDPHTGSFTTVGKAMPMRFGNDFWTAMAFDPYDGMLWGASQSGDLFRIDPGTGTPTLVGNNGFLGTDHNTQALHVDGRGALFATTSSTSLGSRLLALDQTDGTGTVIGPMSAERVQGLAGHYQQQTGAQLTSVPERLDFKPAVVGAVGEQQSVTLRNVGTEDVTISDISDPGAPFILDGPASLPLVLPPGGRHTINVTFAPATTGTFHATLVLTSNDPDAPTSSIALSAESVQMTPAAVGVSYASTGNDNSAELLTVDLHTGEGTLVGPLGLDGVPALAINASGELFGIEGRSSDLYRIDASTGAAAFVGSTDLHQLAAVAFDTNDVLYGLAQDASTFDWHLYRIDTSTGAATAVGDTLPYYLSWEGMAFNPIDGSLWASTAGRDIFTIDLETAAPTRVGATKLDPIVPALQFDDHGYLFGVSGYGGVGQISNLVSIDQTSGVATVIGPIGFSAVSGMDIRTEELTGAHANIYPQQIDFGKVYADSVSAVHTVTLRSVGTEPLTVSIAEPDAPFSLRNASSSTLEIAPGEEEVLEVVFSPTGVGSFNATLAITTDDPDAPSRDVALSGEGSALPAAGTLFGIESFTEKNLVTIDPATGAVSAATAIPDLNNTRIADVDFRQDGVLFGSVNGAVVRFDLLTGQPTLVTEHQDGFLTALEFDEEGTLFGIYSSDPYWPEPPPEGFLSTLVIVDPSFGTFTEIGKTGTEDITGLAFAPEGTLYGVTIQSGPRGPSELVTIDTTTGAATIIGSTGFPGVSALEFAPDGTLYGGLSQSLNTAGSLITIDPTTGEGTVVGGAELAGLSGLSFFPDDLPTDIEEDESTIPETFTLFQNYPNPFNPTTTIRFALPRAAHVKMDVFNLLGQRVAVLVDAERAAGYHTLAFDASRLPSGTYVYRLQAGDEVAFKSMLLVK